MFKKYIKNNVKYLLKDLNINQIGDNRHFSTKMDPGQFLYEICCQRYPKCHIT